jgi:anaerobic ribonucleoside-triphosphate reductase
MPAAKRGRGAAAVRRKECGEIMEAKGPVGREDADMAEPREGAFDAQLLLPTPFVEAPQPIRTILKRDGREVPFEKAKIADAIFRAAQTIGGQDYDRATSLATGVTIYLMKRLAGATPTVDQVHDAVEKVLIEMGHARTALAYARYRDKRARMRQWRAGNIRALLKELADAEGEPPPARPEDGPSLYVRTSAEAVLEWDRGRIVRALVRETDLDESVAAVIARDVEQQIVAAGVRTLTAALVRELVDAKLIELGLEEHRRRHARLGVPLYDAERILCAPNRLPGEASCDPEATNGILAEQVKKEYALARVYRQSVADAHLRGQVHFSALGAVDRLHGVAPSLEFVKLFGGGHDRPPRSLDALLWQVARFNAALLNHVSGWIRWESINVYMAPFVQRLSPEEQREAARTLLFLLSHGGPGPGRSTPELAFSVSWDTPDVLRRLEAIGPGGAGAGLTYLDLEPVAQQFAWMLLEAWKGAVEERGQNDVPVPIVCLTHEFWRTAGHADFLGLAADAALLGGVQFHLDRSVLPGRAPLRPWQPSQVVAQETALNLPRLAYGAADEAELSEELESVFELVVQGHRDKLAFLDRLLSLEEVGPLALLARHRDGARLVEPERVQWLVCPVGLNECVQRLTGASLADSEEARTTAVRLLEHLRVCCDRRTERDGLAILPATSGDPRTAVRFAEADLAAFHDAAAAVVKPNAAQELAYTPGVGFPHAPDISPLERLRLEGRLHDWVEAFSPTPVPVPEGTSSGDSVASFLEKAFFHTSNARIRFDCAD